MATDSHKAIVESPLAGGVRHRSARVRPATHPASSKAPAALLLADLAAAAVAFSSAVLLWFVTGHPLDPAFYASLWPLIALFAIAYASAGLYRAVMLHPAEELRRLSIATSLVCLSLAAVTFLAKEGVLYSRAVFLLTWVFLLVLAPLARALVRRVCGAAPWWGEPAVVIGTGESAQRLLDQIASKPSLGLRPIAVRSPLDAEPEPGVRCAVVCGPDLPPAMQARLLFGYQQAYSRVILAPDAGGLPSLWVAGTDLNGILGLEMSHRLLEPWSVRLKQVSDVAMATVISLAALPLLALIAAAVKISSPGPVFFGHTRRGRNGMSFTAWKFRTMALNADQLLEDHLRADPRARMEWERAQKLEIDPRVTAVGRWLRRTSFDELPQLWNVLRREMSLVGPRPIIDSEIPRYGDAYAVYQRVLPGLTGLWQVSGRNQLPYSERVKLDLYYVTNWSLWLDLYILARTIRAVIRGDGAY